MKRHRLLALLFLLPAWLSAGAQNYDLPVASPVDAVNLYIVPTDDISEQAAGQIARALTGVTGLWIKSTTWAPSGKLEPFAGTNQYAAEDYLPIGPRVGRMLKEVSPRTYFIVLTNRDINSSTRNFRFQYSLHSPMTNTSVLSVARLPQGERSDSLWEALNRIPALPDQLEKRRIVQCSPSQLMERQMQIHIFRGPGRIFGFTAMQSGENLPQKYAPWTAFKTIELRRDEPTPGVDANECLDDVETHGIHVTDAHVRITEEALL